ncbi:hypothetical protein BKA93DRAFT_817078 [Sparassis latifolia]
MDVFGTLSGEAVVLPMRFAALKREICANPEKMVYSWQGVLKELESTAEEIAARGADVIPQVLYGDVVRGLSTEQIKNVTKAGVIIVKGGVPEQEALSWKQSIREYARVNADGVKGGPPGNIVFYELYNSRPQIYARTHPAVIATQRALLALWHTSSPSTAVSLHTPVAYFDRLRIRPPGPSVFTLGPHIDGGGVERWEDPGFRACFGTILNSDAGADWRAHNPFDVTPRLHAKQDLYNAPNQCSVFRPWQGWTSLSHTGPGEGTLRVLPMLSLATAYIMLRPFFRLRSSATASSLKTADWELDLDGTAFPGSSPGKTQELNAETHPHLRLDRTMVSMPRIAPGDQVYWHCDLVHSVETDHNGLGDSSVLYIPAVPLTEHNATYLREQRLAFKGGLPPPDFPGGDGESRFFGRATTEDVEGVEGRRLLGLEPFEVPSGATAAEVKLIHAANSILA